MQPAPSPARTKGGGSRWRDLGPTGLAARCSVRVLQFIRWVRVAPARPDLATMTDNEPCPAPSSTMKVLLFAGGDGEHDCRSGGTRDVLGPDPARLGGP